MREHPLTLPRSLPPVRHQALVPCVGFLLFTLALLTAPLHAQDPAAERLYREAERLATAGDAAAALAEYGLVVQQFPRDRRAANALGRILRIHRARGDQASMRQTIDALLERYPRTPEAAVAFVRRAELQLEAAGGQADLEAARSDVRRVSLLFGRERYPDLTARSEAKVLEGEVNRLLGDTESAAALFLTVIEDEAPSRFTGWAQLQLAATLLEAGTWPAAAEMLARLVRAGPGPAAAPEDVGRARRLLSLIHRRIVRPASGQPHWQKSGRFAAAGLPLRGPTEIAAAEDGRLIVVDEGVPVAAVLAPDGQIITQRPLRDAVRPWWSRDGTPQLLVDNAAAQPFETTSTRLSFRAPGKNAPLKGIVAAERTLLRRWLVVPKGGKSLLIYGADGQRGGALLESRRPEIVDLTHDALGRLYALDRRQNEIVRIGLGPRFEAVVVSGSWKRPTALSIDNLGNFYVLDRGARRIEVFDRSGRPLTGIGPQVAPEITLRNPRDIAVDGSGRLYIADSKLPYILVLD